MAGDVLIGKATEADVEEVSRFLRTTFQVNENWTPFRPEVVLWKSLAPHPLWLGSRGYVMRRGGEIVAYGCAMPTRFLYAGGELLVVCVIDWAASKTAAGAGVAIYQHIGKFADGLIGVGGSDDAQRVLPRMGFKQRQELTTYARVTRPLLHFLDTRGGSWRDFARLGRNGLRRLRPVHVPTRGWTARRVERFDTSMEAAAPTPGLVSATVCYRNAGILNYFLLCPAARMQGYLLEREGRVAGYFVRALIRGECRIAELWVASALEADWAAALVLAGEVPGASQISLACGTKAAQRAAELAGFYAIARQPVYVKDRAGKLPGTLDANIGMLDTDAFYL
jgi:hypothetical protein